MLEANMKLIVQKDVLCFRFRLSFNPVFVANYGPQLVTAYLTSFPDYHITIYTLFASTVKKSFHCPIFVHSSHVFVAKVIKIENSVPSDSKASWPVYPIESSGPIHETSLSTFASHNFTCLLNEINFFDAVVACVRNKQVLFFCLIFTCLWK